MSKIKDNYFFHIQINDELWRLDINKLILSSNSGSKRPDFELVRHGQPTNCTRLPGMRYLILDSQSYVLGGRIPGMPFQHAEPFEDWANLELIPCGGGGGRGAGGEGMKLSGPKIDPIMVKIEGKTYVLSTKYYGPVDDYTPVLFEVFDPVSRSWAALPNPPMACDFPFDSFISHHCSWGHKLAIFDLAGFINVYDTRLGEWDEDEDRHYFMLQRAYGYVQFEDFILGIPVHGSGVCTYCWKGSVLKANSLLHELDALFQPSLVASSAFITHVDNRGLVLVMYAGMDPYGDWCARVAVFQLHTGDTPPLLADVIAVQTYYFEPNGYPDHIGSFLVSQDNLSMDPASTKPSFAGFERGEPTYSRSNSWGGLAISGDYEPARYCFVPQQLYLSPGPVGIPVHAIKQESAAATPKDYCEAIFAEPESAPILLRDITEETSSVEVENVNIDASEDKKGKKKKKKKEKNLKKKYQMIQRASMGISLADCSNIRND